MSNVSATSTTLVQSLHQSERRGSDGFMNNPLAKRRASTVTNRVATHSRSNSGHTTPAQSNSMSSTSIAQEHQEILQQVILGLSTDETLSASSLDVTPSPQSIEGLQNNGTTSRGTGSTLSESKTQHFFVRENSLTNGRDSGGFAIDASCDDTEEVDQEHKGSHDAGHEEALNEEEEDFPMRESFHSVLPPEEDDVPEDGEEPQEFEGDAYEADAGGYDDIYGEDNHADDGGDYLGYDNYPGDGHAEEEVYEEGGNYDDLYPDNEGDGDGRGEDYIPDNGYGDDFGYGDAYGQNEDAGDNTQQEGSEQDQHYLTQFEEQGMSFSHSQTVSHTVESHTVESYTTEPHVTDLHATESHVKPHIMPESQYQAQFEQAPHQAPLDSAPIQMRANVFANTQIQDARTQDMAHTESYDPYDMTNNVTVSLASASSDGGVEFGYGDVYPDDEEAAEELVDEDDNNDDLDAYEGIAGVEYSREVGHSRIVYEDGPRELFPELKRIEHHHATLRSSFTSASVSGSRSGSISASLSATQSVDHTPGMISPARNGVVKTGTPRSSSITGPPPAAFPAASVTTAASTGKRTPRGSLIHTPVHHHQHHPHHHPHHPPTAVSMLLENDNAAPSFDLADDGVITGSSTGVVERQRPIAAMGLRVDPTKQCPSNDSETSNIVEYDQIYGNRSEEEEEESVGEGEEREDAGPVNTVEREGDLDENHVTIPGSIHSSPGTHVDPHHPPTDSDTLSHGQIVMARHIRVSGVGVRRTSSGGIGGSDNEDAGSISSDNGSYRSLTSRSKTTTKSRNLPVNTDFTPLRGTTPSHVDRHHGYTSASSARTTPRASSPSSLSSHVSGKAKTPKNKRRASDTLSASSRDDFVFEAPPEFARRYRKQSPTNSQKERERQRERDRERERVRNSERERDRERNNASANTTIGRELEEIGTDDESHPLLNENKCSFWSILGCGLFS